MRIVKKGEEDDHQALDTLIEKIIRLNPMTRLKDRDEEDKIRFLREAVRGAEWGLREPSRVTESNYYQSLIYALNTSLRDLALYRTANSKK